MSGQCGSVGWFSRVVYGAESYFCRGDEPNTDPNYLLGQMEKDKVLKEIEKKERNLPMKPDYSNEERQAVKTIQSALVALGVLAADKCEPCWWGGLIDGGYGPKTAEAIKNFQLAKGIRYEDEIVGRNFQKDTLYFAPTGRRVGPDTVKFLKKALEAKAHNKDWKAEVGLK